MYHHGDTTWFLDFRVPKEHPHSAREAFPDSRLWPLLSGGDVEGMAPGQLCALPFFCVQQGAGCCALLLTGGLHMQAASGPSHSTVRCSLQEIRSNRVA